ncbi:MAG: hypothetical protein CMP61_10720 [Flavobacteriales bacterium]|nr:hypothetical protein [Flavobacteriales bacterium]
MLYDYFKVMFKNFISYRILVIFGLSFFCAFGIKCTGVMRDFFFSWMYGFLYCVLLMELGRVLVNKIVSRAHVYFSIFLFLFTVLSGLFTYSISQWLRNQITDPKLFWLFAGGVILITVTVNGIYFLVKINAKERLVLMDQKYVYLQHTFNALKSQNVIEFLKNSLNQTEELIKQKPRLAVQQIEKLTAILRYLLQSRDEKFVQLGAEIRNVKAYCELTEIQLNKTVSLTVNISEQFYTTQIPPLVFQMVLDQQFKLFARKDQSVLSIEVYVENAKFVVVKTSLPLEEENRFKNDRFINNLKQRYQLYNKASGVSELSTTSEYFVKFPLVAG